MIDQVECFIIRSRWKAYFFEKPDQRNSNNSTNFGFKSNVTPPQNEKLTPFENGLYDMMRSIEFKSVRNNFQSTLREDLNKIKPSRNLLMFADKKRNLYEMPPDSNFKRKFDKKAKKLSKELNLEDKRNCYAKKKTLKAIKNVV